jgi:hypothetical protein
MAATCDGIMARRADVARAPFFASPLLALSGHGQRPLTTSAFRGKADIKRHGDESPLMTQSRPDQVKPGQRRYLSGITSSCSVVSTTNMASSLAGFVELALALT